MSASGDTSAGKPPQVPSIVQLPQGLSMALWKDSNTGTTSAAPAAAPHRNEMKESHIASDLTIEGKIVGTGHVRIAGRFKGDVAVDGNVTLDSGARLEGHVKAGVVCVSGELIGNIENAKRVELLETGVINGDVKAGSLTVAAGSRMRGQVEFGYEGEARSAK